jgi:hypothetical protein
VPRGLLECGGDLFHGGGEIGGNRYLYLVRAGGRKQERAQGEGGATNALDRSAHDTAPEMRWAWEVKSFLSNSRASSKSTDSQKVFLPSPRNYPTRAVKMSLTRQEGEGG